jgi:hypothetical protein
MTAIIITTVIGAVLAAVPATLLIKWLKQRKAHKMWVRLTDGQEATEL